MTDLVLGAFLALLLVRGWVRGFVREAMDLVGLVVGIIAAFRLSPTIGTVVGNMSGLSEGAARLVGGAIVFLGVGLAAAWIARRLEQRARMPGLNMINRAWGAGLALAWGAFITTLLLSLLAIAPTPSVVSAQLDGSVVGRVLTDPDGLPQRVFTTVSGDRVVRVLLNLRELVGDRRVILEGEEVLSFEPSDSDKLDQKPGAAEEMFELTNRARLDAGLDPLAWSPALADVAVAYATEMYLQGSFGHRSPVTGRVGDRLESAGIAYVVAGENLAMAASPDEVHRGWMESEGHRGNILGERYRRIGIGVVDGPLGLMAVQVFTA